MFLKPSAIPNNSDNHKLLGWAWSILNKITFIQISHLQQKLNLRNVVTGNFGFYFTGQGTLDFNQETILGDTVCRSTEPWILWVSNNPNLMRYVTVPLVIQVPCCRLEKRPVRRGCISSPFGLENLFFYKRVCTLVPILPDCTCNIARRNHIFSEC